MMGHHWTHASQQTASLLDHLVGADEQRGRHREAGRFGSFHVDHQGEFGGPLHWQVGRLGAFEDLVDVVARTAHQIGSSGPYTTNPPAAGL
jgi:hypothetical protein